MQFILKMYVCMYVCMHSSSGFVAAQQSQIVSSGGFISVVSSGWVNAAVSMVGGQVTINDQCTLTLLQVIKT